MRTLYGSEDKVIATRFVQQATDQLAPAYNQQISGLQAQVPAIQQLYSTLMQSLGGQQATGNQSILEDAGGRGLLHSTIPLAGQAQLGQQILQQQGQYAAQEAKDIGGVQSQIGGVYTQQAGAIAQLANSLQGAATSQQALTLQQQNVNRQFAQQQQLQKQQYQLGLQAARL